MALCPLTSSHLTDLELLHRQQPRLRVPGALHQGQQVVHLCVIFGACHQTLDMEWRSACEEEVEDSDTLHTIKQNKLNSRAHLRTHLLRPGVRQRLVVGPQRGDRPRACLLLPVPVLFETCVVVKTCARVARVDRFLRVHVMYLYPSKPSTPTHRDGSSPASVTPRGSKGRPIPFTLGTLAGSVMLEAGKSSSRAVSASCFATRASSRFCPLLRRRSFYLIVVVVVG